MSHRYPLANKGDNSSGPRRQNAEVIVFVPAHAEVYQGKKEPAFEVRERGDGTRDLPVFTSLERLVQALGRYQPWVALPLAEVREKIVPAGIDRMTVDPAGSAGMWRWGRQDLEALRDKILASAQEASREEGAAGGVQPGRWQ